MSSFGSNPFKSGAKPSNITPDDCYEDELSQWLQYPMEDAFERNYCSDLFGHWMVSSSAGLNSGSSKQSTEVGVHGTSMVATGVNCNANNSEAGNMFRSDMNKGFVEMSHKDRLGNTSLTRSMSAGEGHKGRYGVSEAMKPNTASGALALGAQRAAGTVQQSGSDAFGKVRTSMNKHPPTTTNQISNSSSPVRTGMKSDVVKVIAGHQALKQTVHSESQNTLSESAQPMAGLRRQVSNAIAMGIKGYNPNSPQLAPDHHGPKQNPSVPYHLQVSKTQESGCSHVTEEFNIRRPCEKKTSSATSKGQVEADAVKKINPHVHDGQPEKQSLVCGSTDTVQASTDISTKEVTHNRKHNRDDSESPSEDAEGESVEVKPPRKTSTSKRNRAAEVHNLSERNRRNRINEKLKALQELIPNSCKTDKASVLDEAIEYMKTLQLQLQMVSMRNGMTVSPMVIPVGMPHMQMAPVHSVGIGVPIGHAGMGIGMGMGMGMGVGVGVPIGSSMGLVDFSQGVTTSGHQVVPAAAPDANASFQDANLASMQDPYRASNGIDSLRSDDSHMLQQNSSQPSDYAIQTSQSLHLHQQQRQQYPPS